MGTMVYESMVAAELLAKEGINATVVNCHTVKPLDATTIITVAKNCGCVVTAEEHQVLGGLGGAVAELLSSTHPVPILRIGVQNKFGQSGTPDELLKLYGLKSTHIVSAAKQAIKMKYSTRNDDNRKKPVEKELAGRVLKPVHQSLAFRTKTGIIISSLPQLHKAIRTMDPQTFNHHVTNARNDFAQWVADVHKDPDLAIALQAATTPISTAHVIGARISQLVRNQ